MSPTKESKTTVRRYESLGKLLTGLRKLQPGGKCLYSGKASIDGSMYAVREYSGIRFKTWKTTQHGERVVVVERPTE
jgi:hypothetical protein